MSGPTDGIDQLREQLAEANAELDRLREEVAQRDSWLQASLDSAESLVAITDPDGRIRAINRKVEEYLGIGHSSALGRTIAEVFDDAKAVFGDYPAVQQAVAALTADPTHEPIRTQLTGPHKHLVALLAAPMVDSEGSRVGAVWVMYDVGTLEKTAAELRAIVEASPVPLIITRQSSGEILLANDELASLVGIPRKELIGRKSPDFYARPSDREELLDLLGRDGMVQGHEVEIRRASGEQLWVTFSLVATKVNGEGVIIGGLYNIDARKRAEGALKEALEQLEEANQHLRQTQSQLVQSEKMAALGSMVAGIAHEINTPIGAISSMQDTLIRAVEKLKTTLADKYPDYTEHRKLTGTLRALEEAYKVIESGSTRVSQIVRRLRSFARLDEADLKRANLHEGIEDTLVLIHHKIKNRITIDRQYGEVPEINCFPGQLNQVFLNVLVNAAQAIDGNGTITIKTWAERSRVLIAITDTGGGIPPENLEKIFDPGFTTKGVGVGTGLGLAICYQIIQAHRGSISVESEVGKGTTFTIGLPTDLDEPVAVDPPRLTQPG